MTDMVHQFEDAYVFHPRSKQILAQWRRLHALGRGENRGTILSGVPGVGKSKLAMNFLESLPRCESVEADDLPYLYYALSEKISPSNILRALLRLLGCPVIKADGYDELLSALCEMVVSRRVQWLVLDEFQRLLSQSTRSFHAPAVNFITQLSDKIKIPFLLICEPIGLKIVEKNNQTSGRFPRLGRLEPMSVDTETEREYYTLFLQTLQETIPWQSTSLSDPAMMYRLFAATNGNNRFLKSLIVDASTYANLTCEEVTREHYAQAFNNLASQSKCAWNPFTTDIRQVRRNLGVK